MGFLRGKGHGVVYGWAVAALASTWLALVPTGASAQREQHGPFRPSPAEELEPLFAGPRSPSELRRRVALADPHALLSLFQLTAQGHLSGTDGHELVLSEEERAAVREALAARPRRELLPLLEDLARGPLATALRLESQLLLGRIGSAEQLKLLVRSSLPADTDTTLMPELRSGFSAALAAILQRDSSAVAQITGLFSESSPALTSSIIEALSNVPSPEATRVLASLLGRSPGLDPLLLARLGERRALYAPRDESVFESVRRYLRHRDLSLVSSAAGACGALGDDGAVVQLIGLLEGCEPRVQSSVFGALRRISGLDFGTDSARWTSWYHAEMRWWDEEAESLLVRIERGRGLEFVRAARQALEHRLFRDRIAEAFTQALRHEHVQEVLLSCRALEQLRSPVAVRGLIECLESGDRQVRAAAWKALRAITGVELPPESDSWAELAG